MTCETIGELLLDYIEGALAPDRAQSVREHLDQCPRCATKSRELRALVGDLGAARSVQQASDSGRSRTQPLQGMALDGRARLGDFEIIEELGRGGMGVVYRARQLSLNRIVALKLLSTHLLQNERSITRFLREAQAAARLHHTNIVPIYAQGREGDYFYYAMELIEGESLDKALHREMQTRVGEAPTVRLRGTPTERGASRPLSSATALLRSAVATVGLSRIAHRHGPIRDFKRIVRLAAGVAEGLHHAHEQGIVHRDIKPQNLLLGPDDELHITDFGLARMLDEPGLTHSTEMVGTPAYMAPEQITGPSTAIDRRTDVYSLGVTLYVMLTLRRPFEGETYEQTINQILRREPQPPRKIDPRIPVDLETICLRAMEKEPHGRFPTAGEMAHDLRRWAEGFAIASRPIGPVAKTIRWARRNPARASASGAAILLAMLIPVAAFFSIRTGEAQLERAWNVLRDDYRESDRALNELGCLSGLPGLRNRRAYVEAFAYVRDNPEESVERLERLLASSPDDVDAHYLLAFAYMGLSYTQGTERLADAQRHIDLADGLEAEPSAAGWFFRGQALLPSSPEEAADSFNRAIEQAGEEGFTFAQAMLHQGRALNQMMYSWRDLSHYTFAVTRLDYAARLQPAKAYPHYLLSITHLLAAEIYLAEGNNQAAEAAYEKSLQQALEAQTDDPTSARGYAAEAGYYESRGKFAAAKGLVGWRQHFSSALTAWRRIRSPKDTSDTSAWDWSERSGYSMRLHFWLGEYDYAERMRADRYGSDSGYDRREEYDADDSFYEAINAASAGDLTEAEQALRAGVELARGHPEYLLRLHSASRLIGCPPPSEFLSDETWNACKLSPGWTPRWLATLTRYERGQGDWTEVETAAREGTERRDDERLRMAGAWFLRGVSELAAGQRDQALTSLERACDQHDNENYCFRAQFLLVKLRTDPQWPGWPTGERSDRP
jgi:serine/threonine protein kinase